MEKRRGQRDRGGNSRGDGRLRGGCQGRGLGEHSIRGGDVVFGFAGSENPGLRPSLQLVKFDTAKKLTLERDQCRSRHCELPSLPKRDPTFHMSQNFQRDPVLAAAFPFGGQSLEFVCRGYFHLPC